MTLAPLGQRLAAALATLLLFADAVVRPPWQAGLSTFGQPPAAKVFLAVVGLAAAALLGRARDRESLARRMTLLLLATLPFGGRAVPASPGLTLLLAGLTLVVARPFLRTSTSALLTLGVLAACVPSVVTSVYPQGSVTWALQILPYASLPLLVPSLFAGVRARRPAALVVAVTSVLCLVALLDYLSLADGLSLPLSTVVSTRLRPVGLHPNLAVPQIVTSLVLALALVWDGHRRQRVVMGTCALALVVALAAVGSRTGTLTAAAGAAMLVLGRMPWRAARFVRPLAAVAVAAALLVPMTGLTDTTITHRSDDMASKAVSFRSAMWELGRDAFAAAPWHGYGPNTLFMQGIVARPGRYDGLPKDDHPHNVALAVGASLGWPGLLALAALVAAGLRRRTGGPLLVDGCTAALCAMFIANGIDLGGATGTMLPSLAFLLLALGDATAGARAPHALPAPVGRGVSLVGVLLVAWGLGQGVADRAILSANTTLGEAIESIGRSDEARRSRDGADTREDEGRRSAAPTPQDVIVAANARRSALGALDVADALLPCDPLVPRLRARAHALPPSDDAQRAADLEEALRRQPHSAALHHDLAFVLLRLDPDDRRADEHLDEALRLDPHGPEAGRVQIDRAVLAAHRGRRDEAFDALVEAVVIDASSILRCTYDPIDDTLGLSLGVEGGGRVTFPLEKLLAELHGRRDALAGSDPLSAVRLGMREVDVLQTLAQWERADAIVAERFTDPRYFTKRLAESAERQGDYEEALRRTLELGHQDAIWLMVDALRLRAHAAFSDEDAFDALLREVEATLGDAIFEKPNYVGTLTALKLFAEKTLDAAAAARWQDALDYAAR